MNSRFNSKYYLTLSVLLLLALAVSPVLLTTPASADWGPVIQLVSVGSSSPGLAVDGDNVEVVWTLQQTIQQVHYQRSADGGYTWGADVTLSDPSLRSSRSAIASADGTTHVVFNSGATVFQSNIFYIHSLDGGQTWGTRLALTGNDRSFMPKIAVSGDNVYVVWSSDTAGSQGINFSRSTDGGQTWSSAILLNSGSIGSDYFSIAASGSLVHAVWMDNSNGTIYYARSENNGQTWSTQVALPTGGNQCFYPAVAASGNTVHIIFLRIVSPGFDVRYVRSVDGGQTLADDTLLGISLTAQNDTAAITASGDNVYATWGSRVGDMSGIFNYSQSSDGGATWSDELTLVDGVMRGIHPGLCLVAQGRNLYAVWGDMRTGIPAQHVFYRLYAAKIPVRGSVNTSHGLVGFEASNGRFVTLQQVPAACVLTGYNLPYGMFSFTLDRLTPGETVTLTITLPSPIPAECRYFKCYGGSIIDCSSYAMIQGNVITLTLTDGGNGDSDHLVNRIIVDPGGPAFPVASAQSTLIGTGGGQSSSGLPVTPLTAGSPIGLSAVSVQSASISTEAVSPGMPVTVTADIANRGTVNGSKKVTLYVNGKVESTQGVTVNSGSTSKLTFNVSRSEPGDYTVYVDGVPAGSFKVEMVTGNDGILIFSVALVALTLIIGMVMLLRRI